jgi:geranyl-CoA carboxylase alpha subunit
LASTEVLAPTAGLVVKVSVEEGATVAAGQSIIVLQSMKTEIDVVADVAGKVSKINVKKGDEVNIGQTVAEIES